MHICDHHIKVYYNIEKRKLVKIEIEIYRGGQKFLRGDRTNIQIRYRLRLNFLSSRFFKRSYQYKLQL